MDRDLNIGDIEYAEYMVAKYYNGYTDIAIFLAVFLFEKYMINKAKSYEKEYKEYLKSKQEKNKDYRFDLGGAISIYCKNNKATNYKELDLLRRFRNHIVHKNFQIEGKRVLLLEGKDVDIDYLIDFVYSNIVGEDLPKSFFKKLGKDPSQVLLQDYKIKEIDETMQSIHDKQRIKAYSKEFNKFSKISKDKFENLFELRRELLKLQLYLTKNMDNVGLTKTILTPVDTTSAYIWMPFIDSNFLDISSIIETKRNNLVMGSVSILATPMDFRIYIDFGGGDMDFRTSYQKFLKSKQFKEYIVRYRNDDVGLKIFTTKWYSFKVFEFNYFNALNGNDRLEKMTDSALRYLAGIRSQNSIVTSGRNLIGYIFEPNDSLPKELILEYFKKVAHIYYEFLIFKYPKHEKKIRKKQLLLIEDNTSYDNEEIQLFDEINDE